MEIITSRSNPVCAHIKKLGRNRKYRDENGKFLCDGEKLLDEAIKSGTEIDIIITSKTLQCKLPEGTRVYHADLSLIESISPLKNPRDLLFSCKIPAVNDCSFYSGTNMLLDRIQDPGNVGNIIRSAHAFGLNCVILTEGSADIYNPKTVRASMGAIFKQRFHYIKKSEIHKLKKDGVKFIGTSINSSCTDITKEDLRNSVIIVGNEGQGISNELLAICDDMISIPMSSDCESLNVAVAASIIMWEAAKR